MKKMFLIIPCALLAACTSDVATDQPIDPSAGERIFFELSPDALTRGTVVTQDNITEGSFRIYATQQRGDEAKSVFIDYAEGQDNTVSYLHGSWQTATTYLWPQNSYNVDFYAVYPATTDVPLATGMPDAPQLAFTGDENSRIDGNTDLLVAHTTASRGNRTADNNEPVQIDFQHALTQVSFKGVLNEPFQQKGWQVTVSDITLRNINCAGSLDLATGQFAPDVDDDQYPQHTIEYNFPIEGTIDITNAAQPLSADVAMLMPQTVTPWDIDTESVDGSADKTATKGAYLDVLCRIMTNESAYLLGNSDNFAHAYVPLTDTEWVPGKHYAYTLSFGAGYKADGTPNVGLPTITLTYTVSEWMDGGTTKGKAVFE